VHETWSHIKGRTHIEAFFFENDAPERKQKKQQEAGENCTVRSFNCIVTMIKSRRVIWAGHAACMGKMRNAYKILVWKPEGIKPSGRPRHIWRIRLKWILEK
jgi:hypothetical protein